MDVKRLYPVCYSHAVHARERFRLRCVENGAREPRMGFGRPHSVPQKGKFGVDWDPFSRFLLWDL